MRSELPPPTIEEPPKPVISDMDTVARCLTDKGVTFYGAYWCPHCADQKKQFGDAMKNITYVECDPEGENAQAERCLEENITSYPTWIFPDGERLVGARSPDVLAEKAGCL